MSGAKNTVATATGVITIEELRTIRGKTEGNN